MRCAGVLPYAWVADNTRWMRKPRTDGSLEACLRRTAARRTAPCKELLKEIGGREICDCWRKLARPVTFFAEASPANSVVGGIGELFRKMARPAGFEPATPGLEGRCSIQLSYGRVNVHCRAFAATVSVPFEDQIGESSHRGGRAVDAAGVRRALQHFRRHRLARGRDVDLVERSTSAREGTASCLVGACSACLFSLRPCASRGRRTPSARAAAVSRSAFAARPPRADHAKRFDIACALQKVARVLKERLGI